MLIQDATLLATTVVLEYEKPELELVKLEDSISRYPHNFRLWRRLSIFHLRNHDPEAACLECQLGTKKFGTIALAPLIELSCLFALMSDYSKAIGTQLLAVDHASKGDLVPLPEWGADEFSQLTKGYRGDDSGKPDDMAWKRLDEHRRLSENGSGDQRYVH
jgi:hypothetical protein